MIRIEININTTRLSGNTDLLSELYDYLSFRHPNAFFIQKKMRGRQWDGMVHPLTPTGLMATGLLDKAMAFLTDKGETRFEVKDHRNMPKFRPSLKTTIAGLELRPYQVEAIEVVKNNTASGVVANPRGVLQMSMNSGKSLVAMGLYENIIDAKVLILINSSVVYKQFKQDLSQAYPDTYGYMQGASIQWGDIMICMIPTLKNRLTEYRKQLAAYNVLLVDEADLAVSATATTIYKSLWHIAIRIGLTGTAFIRELAKDRVRNLEMRKIFGEPLMEVTMKDLEDMGVSTPVDIQIYTGNNRDMGSPDFITEFFDCIVYNDKRDRKLLRLVKKQSRQGYFPLLIVNKYVEQCERVYELMKKHLPSTSIGIIHTNTPSKDKAKVLSGFKKGEIQILVANLLIKRGLNLPLIKSIINNAAGAHPSGPLQIIGRGARTHSSKERFRFIDIYDKGKYLTKQSKHRIVHYKRQKLNIEKPLRT